MSEAVRGAERGARHRRRIPLVALGVLSLAGALWGGLARIGWDLPPAAPWLAAHHGPLMVSGFLGTVIGLERAVALGAAWSYAAPILTGAGGLVLVLGAPVALAAALMTGGAACLVGALVVVLRRQPALFTLVMTLGGVTWLVGQALWLAGWPVYTVVSWWTGFLVLTIAGERLELSRLTRPGPASQVAFAACLAAVLAGLLVSVPAPDTGARLSGAALVGLAAWLARYDVARRTVRQAGLTRFIACCLLSGYAWLAAAGVLGLVGGGVAAGPRYDAVLHAVFVGFVFAMIFGHAPIIIPAVAGWRVAYSPAFYAHLALLHLTLVVRVGGDLAESVQARRWGGLLNAAALALFALNTARGVARSAAGRPATDQGRPTR